MPSSALVLLASLAWGAAGVGEASPDAVSGVASPAVRPKLAVLIDDLGYSRSPHARLVRAGRGLTWAIFPSMPATRFFSERSAEDAACAIVHLSLENHAYTERQVQRFLLLRMPEAELLTLLREHLDSVPAAKGVNNHSGDLGTENRRLMGVVLRELKRRGLFFVDSVTSPRSVCRDVARDESVPFARRDIFLDDAHESRGRPRKPYVAAQLARAAEVARREGSAVAIGHPHKTTLEVLARELPLLERGGIELVPVSALVAPVEAAQ